MKGSCDHLPLVFFPPEAGSHDSRNKITSIETTCAFQRQIKYLKWTRATHKRKSPQQHFSKDRKLRVNQHRTDTLQESLPFPSAYDWIYTCTRFCGRDGGHCVPCSLICLLINNVIFNAKSVHAMSITCRLLVPLVCA